MTSKYRGAQGLDPEFIKSLEKQFGFDKPAHERFFLMMKNYLAFDFGKSYFRDVSRAAAHQGEAARLDLARPLDDADHLPDLDPARHPQGGARRRDVRHLDSGVLVIGYAIPGFLFAVLLLVVFAGSSFFQWFPSRGLTSDNWNQLSLAARSSTISGI